MGHHEAYLALKSRPTIEELLAMRAMMGRIGHAASTTARTGLETGVQVIESVDTGAIYLSPLIIGGTDGLPSPSTWIDALPVEQDYQDLFRLHFHSRYETLDLSIDDLAVTNCGLPDWVGRPVVIVGTISPEGAGHLLVLQKASSSRAATSGALRETWDRYLHCSDSWPSPSFGRSIEVPGFLHADVVSFRMPPRRRTVEFSDLSALRRFDLRYGYGVTWP